MLRKHHHARRSVSRKTESRSIQAAILANRRSLVFAPGPNLSWKLISSSMSASIDFILDDRTAESERSPSSLAPVVVGFRYSGGATLWRSCNGDSASLAEPVDVQLFGSPPASSPFSTVTSCSRTTSL